MKIKGLWIMSLLWIASMVWAQDEAHLGIAYASDINGNYDIFVLSPDGNTNRQLTTDTAHDTEPAWSFGGEWIAFISDRDGNSELYVMDSKEGADQTRLTETDLSESSPSWSQDGSEIVFTQKNETDEHQLLVLTLETGEIRLLTTGYNAAWSPDGETIAFIDVVEDIPQIHLIDADGENRRLLLSETWHSNRISWSPDGEWLVFDAQVDDQMDIYRVRENGQDLTQLTTAPAIERDPTWRPDGERIIFSSNEDGDFEIYTMALDGSDVKAFTQNKAGDINPNCTW